MPRRSLPLIAGVAVSLLVGACAGSDDTSTASGQATTTTAVAAPASTTTTMSPMEGVQTYGVEAGHSDAPVNYPQVPPVGGLHNPVWQQCAFYDTQVPIEKAVHSLEHGAIWITYRPDLPAAEIDTLATLARSRNYVLASRWDNGLPSPVVITAWGRQLRLESATDPRLAQFVRLYANQGPEINAAC